MIADNFWKILLVLILIAGGTFWFKSYRKSSDFKTNASELADYVAFSEGARPATAEEASKRFIKAVTLLYDAEQDGTDPNALLNAAFDYNDISFEGAEAELVRKSMFDSIRSGKALGIFNETSIWQLRQGEHVPITKGPYENEATAIALHVPSAIGPGAELFVGNFGLVPESVAAVMQDVELTEKVLHTSGELANALVITRDRYTSIKDAYYDKRDAAKN